MTATLIATPPALEGVRAAGLVPSAPVIGAGVAGAPPQGVAAAPVLVPGVGVPLTPDAVAPLSDDALLALHRSLAEQRRRLEASLAVVSAEIGHRSRRELGADGLAQSRGLRTAEALVQEVSGLTAGEARVLARVGSFVADQSRPTPVEPWLRAVGSSATAGTISLAVVDAIRAGLGMPAEGVTADQLETAAEQLLLESRSLAPEKLAARARELRDALDEAGIADREEQRRERRYLSLTPLPDGMTRVSGLLDPESAAIVVGAIDAITSPRRGGPRFVDASQEAPADDPRTIPQLFVDALVDIVRVATLADDGTVFGAKRVGVRVHVAERDLRRGAGAAQIEGQTAAVSMATAERLGCDAGLTPILFSFDGQPIDVGRTQRHFTARQRVALAARDGGCRAPGCDRPPAWCEAHHIDEWLHDHGETNVDVGILLCRFHHLLMHNRQGWIERVGPSDYRMVLPDKTGELRRTSLPSHSRIVV
jgi:hypothetical protein